MPTPPLDRLKITAGRFLKVAGPPARTVRDRVTREVGERLAKRRGPAGAGGPAPTTEPTAPTAPAEPPARRPAGPTPASIAKNVAHERPHAEQPPAVRRDPEAMPGGKLPPRRPRPA